MNNNQLKKGLDSIQEIKLTSQEKELILSRIVEQTTPRQTNYQKDWQWFIFSQKLWHKRFTPVIALCLIVLLGSGGTIFASENALPGDLLYPVKINIAEPAGDILAVSVNAKAKREVKKIDRRLNETERLVDEGRLNSETIEVVQKRLTDQLDKFDNLKKQLEKTASAEEMENINSNLEVQINAHSNILAEVGDHASTSQKNEIEKIKKTVEEKREKIQKDRQDSETKLMTERKTKDIETKSFEDDKKEVSDYIKNTEEKLTEDYNNSKGVSKDILENASGTLRQARDKIDKAENENNSGEIDKAFISLLSAKRDAREADISIKKSSDFNKKYIKKEQKDNQNNSSTTETD